MEVGDELYRYGTSLKLLRRSGLRTKLRQSNYFAVCTNVVNSILDLYTVLFV
jgi:hypothetical protein